jgi:hypothetical protein
MQRARRDPGHHVALESPEIPGVTVYSVGGDDFAYGAAVWQSGTLGTRFVVAGAAVNSRGVGGGGHSTFNTSVAGFTLGGVVTLVHTLSTQLGPHPGPLGRTYGIGTGSQQSRCAPVTPAQAGV